MVAVSHRDADKFIASASAQIDVFLIFGTDTGLVSERSLNILRRFGFDPRNADQVLRLEGDALAGDPGLLFDETHSTGLFAEKRSILIRSGTRQFTSAIEMALEQPATDCKVVIQGGALRKEAPLRTLVTRARNGAAIECYPDQAKDVERLVEEELRATGLAIDPDARDLLVSLLGDDRLVTRTELEKLALYANGKKQVSEADVFEAVADASAFAQDALVFAAFSGKLAELGEESTPIYRPGNEAASLLAAAQRQLHMLHSIRVAVDSGVGVDIAIERAGGRGLFGARREMLNNQIRVWHRTNLAQLIEEINQVVKASRADADLAAPIVMEFLFRVARQARSIART